MIIEKDKFMDEVKFKIRSVKAWEIRRKYLY